MRVIGDGGSGMGDGGSGIGDGDGLYKQNLLAEHVTATAQENPNKMLA